MKNLLDLTSDEAREYFLRPESYCNIDLPQYFQFGEILGKLSSEIGEKDINSCFNDKKNLRPNKYDDVNYKLLYQKGQYSWRLLQIINPIIYVSLVHEITREENWSIIKERFSIFRGNPQISCVSIPIYSQDSKSAKSVQILNWIEHVESESIALGLEYAYLFQTDIAECYPSIYTHSIPWSLHGKEQAKKLKGDQKVIGNIVDNHIQMMSFGQTNGIPQGSSLMDFIAEIVLGYADNLLSEKLNSIDADYHIIRYRDDYRIFVNNPQVGEDILKNLTDVLAGLGMKLKGEKTSHSNNIIQDSIKPDKLYDLVHVKTSKNIAKELYIIYSLSEKFPNSGTITRRLQNLLRVIRKKKDLYKDHRVIVSILVAIAVKNSKSYPIVVAILSKIISCIASDEEKREILVKIQDRFNKLPNTEYLDIWIQRVAIKMFSDTQYFKPLTQLVAGENIPIWNCEGFTNPLQELIKNTPIINQDILTSLDPVISSEEVEVFHRSNYSY